jgi:hypothetical protein
VAAPPHIDIDTHIWITILIGSWSVTVSSNTNPEFSSNFANDGQSASSPWCRTPICGSWPDFYYCRTFTVFTLWGAISDYWLPFSSPLKTRIHCCVYPLSWECVEQIVALVGYHGKAINKPCIATDVCRMPIMWEVHTRMHIVCICISVYFISGINPYILITSG